MKLTNKRRIQHHRFMICEYAIGINFRMKYGYQDAKTPR